MTYNEARQTVAGKIVGNRLEKGVEERRTTHMHNGHKIYLDGMVVCTWTKQREKESVMMAMAVLVGKEESSVISLLYIF
jgi:hypothetical protein